MLALSAPFITQQEYVVLFGIALFYPHLALYRTLHSRDWRAAEFQHVTLDGFVAGLVMSIVHFNPWVSLLMAFQMILNGVVTGGMSLASWSSSVFRKK